MKFALLLALVCPAFLCVANTTVRHDPASRSVGPFPSNALTAPAASQKTGLQVNLPLPAACVSSPTRTECTDTLLLNQLDGFSVNPRIMVCFSGPVQVGTINGAIHLAPLDTPTPAVAINEVLFDPASNCVYAKPDQVLDQQSRYLLIVTNSILDSGGIPVSQDSDFADCSSKGSGDYCKALSKALDSYIKDTSGKKVPSNTVSASLFTTLSATTWLQQARAQVQSMPEAVLPAGFPYTFTLNSVKSITWKPQTGAAGVNYDQPLPLNKLAGVDRISFGLFLSPNYLSFSGPLAGSIPVTPTDTPISEPNAILPVSFHVFLPPASAMPAGGFPVIIYGHGLSDSQFGAPTFVASTWASKGFATLAIEITGHGFGPFGTAQIVTNSGSTSTVLTPGRGIQFSPTKPIGATDGCILSGPLATRDCSRQTAVDLFALVRTIRNTNGLGLNLNPSKIYYVGQSFGSFYGTSFEAVERNVGAGTLNSGGGTQTDVARLSPIARQLGSAFLAGQNPSLLNVPPAPSQPYFHDRFNDEYVYRDQVVTDSVPGALPIQAAFEVSDWLGMLGDPLAYAPHLQRSPLAGVPAKPILVQFGLGDLEIPNPTESALVRAGSLQASTWLFRFDLALGKDPRLAGVGFPPFPILPHRFLSSTLSIRRRSKRPDISRRAVGEGL